MEDLKKRIKYIEGEIQSSNNDLSNKINLSANKERLKQSAINELKNNIHNNISTISHLSFKNLPNETKNLEIVPRSYEEKFLTKGKCSNDENCVGYLLPCLHDWPCHIKGFSLIPFITPNGISFSNICLLCLRKKITMEWLQLIKNNIIAPVSLLPYQNDPNDYNQSDLIPISPNDDFRGISHPFVFFSFSKYMFDSGQIVHRNMFYQSFPMAFLPDYLTIEKCTDTDEKVGFLIDITNIVPYILHPPIFILDKYDQQHQLISFLSKVYHKKTIDDKIKYKYIINSSMYVFPGLSEVDSIKKMINKLISLFIPFYNLNVPVPFKSLPKNNYISIPILRNPNNSFDILTCSQCSTFSIYIYDLYNQLFFCKNNKDHKMITIETKDRLINFHNICYLSCLKCNKLKIISSGLAVPNITSKRKDLNKILKNINMMNAYTQVCLSCSYVDKIICAICGLEHKNTIKKSWQKIKVFNYKKNYIETIHLCHKEKKIKNNDNRIWSYPLLLDLLK